MPDVKYAPKEYKRRNNAIHELYDAFLDMTELVEKPKGNISKYQEKYRKVHRDLVNAVQEFIESEEEE